MKMFSARRVGYLAAALLAVSITLVPSMSSALSSLTVPLIGDNQQPGDPTAKSDLIEWSGTDCSNMHSQDPTLLARFVDG
jgi:hypothetical protein